VRTAWWVNEGPVVVRAACNRCGAHLGDLRDYGHGELKWWRRPTPCVYDPTLPAETAPEVLALVRRVQASVSKAPARLRVNPAR
jgi:hypothetical protein